MTSPPAQANPPRQSRRPVRQLAMLRRRLRDRAVMAEAQSATTTTPPGATPPPLAQPQPQVLAPRCRRPNATGGNYGEGGFGTLGAGAARRRRPMRRRQAVGARLPRPSRRRHITLRCSPRRRHGDGQCLGDRRRGAIATAVANPGIVSHPANASSSAETEQGAMAKALSTISSLRRWRAPRRLTAKTSFGGVSVQSDATNTIFPDLRDG